MIASPNLVGECLRCSEPKTGQVMIDSPNLIGRRLCCSGPVVGWYETVPIRIECCAYGDECLTRWCVGVEFGV